MRRVLIPLSLLLAALAPSSATAATDAPAWSIASTAFPTNFAPGMDYSGSEAGPGISIYAVNVGGGSTDGVFTITETLPAGLTPAASSQPKGSYGGAGEDGQGTEMSCTVVSPTVSCIGGSLGSPPLYSGEAVAVTIPLDVSPSLSGNVVVEASIEGGGVVLTRTVDRVPISSASAPFGFDPGAKSLSLSMGDQAGDAVAQAGSHPFQTTVHLGFTSYLEARIASEPEATAILLASGGGPRDIKTVLPRGLVVNPQATVGKCTEAQLENPQGVECPPASQVGMATVEDSFGTAPGSIIRPLYNMVAPGGSPGVFAFEVLQGTYIHLLGRVRSDGQYELAADADDLLSKVPVLGANVTLWGDPSEDSHSVQRRPCYLADEPDPSCTVTETNASFLTMPSSCGAAPVLSARADSWEAPGAFVERTAAAGDREGNPIALAGCNALRFEPTIESKPTTNRADSPSGLEFDLHQPQEPGFDGLSTANLKDTTVTLPEGIALNPSAAGGRKACSSSQIGLLTPVGQASPVHLSSLPQSCPDASKLGRVEVTTPLLDHPMTGSVYLAKPFDNPFGSLLAIYLALEDEESGIVAKLAGRVAPDPATGQLTTTFAESPELPLEDVKLDLYGGARGALTTPLACGTHTTTSTLTPWSTPEGADAHPADSFETVGGCSSSEASAPNNPSFSAGTVSPLAGAYSPFVLRLARADGSQRLGAIEATLPPGLVGKLAGIPYCSEAAIAQAQSRSHPEEGALEEASPSCPQASEVGTATVAAGSGSTPYQVTGHAYWAGPYKGAPLSMVIITPAVAGPFDLGVVVVRTALQVNSETAQIRAVSDPLPSILDGIPLDIRSVEVKLDRPSFTLNPTSCDPMQLTGSLAALSGQSAAVANRFQVGGCSGLAFKPKLKIRLQGPTRRAAYPALKAVVSMPPGGANIASAQVNLPHSEFVAQEHIKTICTRVQFAAGDGNGSACPPGSVYGRAKAWSPLLDKPLEGLVYLRSSSHELPDLVAALDGQVQIAVAGKVDSGRNGGLRNTFEAVPDAPVSRFVLEMSGGKKGLLVNSENLCSRRAKKRRAIARFVGQNGLVRSFKPRVGTSCKRKHGHRHRHRR